MISTNEQLSLFKTVRIFASLVGQPLQLKNGKVAETRTHTIVIPFESHNAYVRLERQLAHILFRSSSKARDQFVTSLVSAMERMATRISAPVPTVRAVVEQVINILESHRIESLWGLVYPGSHARMREHLREEARKLRPHDSFFDLFVCLHAGVPIPPGSLDHLRPLFEQALREVERRGFAASIIAGRWLLNSLIQELSFPNTDATQAPVTPGMPSAQVQGTARYLEAVHQLVRQFGALPVSLQHHYDDYTLKGDSSDAIISSVNPNDTKRLEAALAESERRMADVLAQVENMKSSRLSHDEWLQQQADGALKFVDVLPEDILIGGEDMFPEDIENVQRLRVLFRRVMGRRSVELDTIGSEVDVPSVIERRLTGRPLPCFKSPASSRGFKALLLLDRSLSMTLDNEDPNRDLMPDARIRKAVRAVQVLSAAMCFPFVELIVWGFQSLEDGEVNITRFAKDVPGYTTRKLPVDGGTPLHIAIQAAANHLRTGAEMKQLVILTDGAPAFYNRDQRAVPTKQLRLMIRDEVRQARQHGIGVSALLIGDKIGDRTRFEVGARDLTFMFGPERFWRCVDDDNLGASLIESVSRSFLSYLSGN